MCVYPNLDKELRNKNMSKKTLAAEVHIRYQTFIVKCGGKNCFTLDEAMSIQKALKTSLTLEQLFERVA